MEKKKVVSKDQTQALTKPAQQVLYQLSRLPSPFVWVSQPQMTLNSLGYLHLPSARVAGV